MIRFRRFDIVEEVVTSDCALDLLDFLPPPPLLINDVLETVTDLIQIHRNPFRQLHLQTLCDRVSNLEQAFERLVSQEEEKQKKKKKIDERKLTWTAEIVTPEKDRRYKWTAESKGLEKSYKYTAAIKGKGGAYPPIERIYTVKVSNGDSSSKSETEEKTKKKKCQKGKSNARTVEIEGPSDRGGVVLRQVFAKRLEKKKGKGKKLSPEDAAALIQMSFRTYLIRRSQSLRALRELAIAKNKLKEIRALFNNFSYRRRISRDAEEHQRFSEKIIVLLLTVDAIEGGDRMVRAAKKSMVDELKAMLDVVDPQPPGKSASMRRRRFDMPDGMINKELAAGVAQVFRMLDEA